MDLARTPSDLWDHFHLRERNWLDCPNIFSFVWVVSTSLFVSVSSYYTRVWLSKHLLWHCQMGMRLHFSLLICRTVMAGFGEYLPWFKDPAGMVMIVAVVVVIASMYVALCATYCFKCFISIHLIFTIILWSAIIINIPIHPRHRMVK